MKLKKSHLISLAALLVTALGSTTALAEEPSPTTAPSSRAELEKKERNDAELEKDRKEAFRIGPLVGVGFPRPLAIEGMVKIQRVVSFGLEYSFLPRTTIGNVEASFKALAADLRVFPFKGGFFIGARVGKQWLDGKSSVTVAPLGTFSESMEASTWFVNPRLGFLYTFESGLTLGIDAGVQLPVNPSYARDGDATRAGVTTSVDQTLKSVAATLGNETTPTVDLLRVGFLF